MLDLNKPADVGYRISTRRMSDFYKSDVGCRMSDIGCRIFTSRMSDFNKPDVGFLQVGCRMAPISFRRKQCWVQSGCCEKE